ncbi:hypothetical protein COHA_006459 [Chlorella ohadii]|uniref:Phage tail collar domain-containing protein n=1 Tax=Chlorella ohadii TaxID=2649997 RepID=A0AAD5DKI9_9CHLO|nr:hypothetical protein COHA_006459 [Chlorella ohadii]
MRLATFALAALLLAACLPRPTDAASSDACYIGEIFMMASTFCPVGSQEANGATIAAASNPALYAILGTRYGGTSTNFKLPTIKSQCAAGSCILYCICTLGLYPPSS